MLNRLLAQVYLEPLQEKKNPAGNQTSLHLLYQCITEDGKDTQWQSQCKKHTEAQRQNLIRCVACWKRQNRDMHVESIIYAISYEVYIFWLILYVRQMTCNKSSISCTARCSVHLHSPDLNGFFTQPQKQEQSLSAVTPQYSTTLKAVIQKHYSSAVTDRFVYVCANSLFCIKRKSALEHRLRQNEQSNYFRALGLQYVMKDHQSQLLNMQNTEI